MNVPDDFEDLEAIADVQGIIRESDQYSGNSLMIYSIFTGLRRTPTYVGSEVVACPSFCVCNGEAVNGFCTLRNSVNCERVFTFVICTDFARKVPMLKRHRA